MPPLSADEHTTLARWLDFYRDTLARKCAGLDEQQMRTASVAPSPLTLLGLVQHMAEVERNWFRRVLLGADAPPIHDPQADPTADDGGFDLYPDVTADDAMAVWRREVDRSRADCADRALDTTSPFLQGEVTLRWIYTHMIGESRGTAATPT